MENFESIPEFILNAEKHLPNFPGKAKEVLEKSYDSHYSKLGPKEKALFHEIMGRSNTSLDLFNEGLSDLDKALKFCPVGGEAYHRVHKFRGIVLTLLYRIDEAKKALTPAVKFFEEKNLPLETAESYGYLGVALLKETKLTESLETLLKGLNLAQEHGSHFLMGRISSFIGIIHLWLKNNPEAKTWFKSANHHLEACGFTKGIAAVSVNLATAQLNLGEPEQCIEALHKALKNIPEKEHSKRSVVAIIHNNMGNAYMHENIMDREAAIRHHKKAYKIGKSINLKNGICHAAYGLVNALTKDRFNLPKNESYEWLEEILYDAKEIAEQSDDLMLNQTTWGALSNYYKALGRFEEAYMYLEMLMLFKEDHWEKEKIASVNTLQIQSELQQKELELQQAELAKKELELQQKRELSEVNKRLEKEVEFRTIKLTLKNRELEEFAYVVAHDLKEPIRSIVGFSQILERKLSGKLNSNEEELFNFILTAGRNMDNLVEGLLKYTTINIQGNFEEINLPNMVEFLKLNLRQSMHDLDAELHSVNLPDHILGVKVRIRQLFQNLVSNALKFRHPERKPVITIGFREETQEFYVQDNGQGIAEEYHEKIFKIFKRLHKRTEVQGTGIGLSICKKIVEQHGGRIRVESVHGEGTTFLFTLPL